MNSELDSIDPSELNRRDLEIKRMKITGNFNPFEKYSDTVPDELIHRLNDIITQQNFLESSQKVLELIISKSCSEKPEIILHYQTILEDDDATESQKGDSLIFLKTIIENTPIEDTLPIDPNFLDILINYFPNTLAISICSDLIYRDISYMDYFSSILSRSQKSLYESSISIYDDFFTSLMSDNFEGALILLKSVLQYKDNLIYLGNVFDDIFQNASECEIKTKIQCFEVLTIYFESDGNYLLKLFQSPKSLTSLFNSILPNPQFIETHQLGEKNQKFIENSSFNQSEQIETHQPGEMNPQFVETNQPCELNHKFIENTLFNQNEQIEAHQIGELNPQNGGNFKLVETNSQSMESFVKMNPQFSENSQFDYNSDELLIEDNLNQQLVETVFKFINEVIRSNEDESLKFFEMAEIDSLILRTIHTFSENSFNFCLDIFIKMIRSHPNEALLYLLTNEILNHLNEIKKEYSYQAFLNFMELTICCINQINLTDVIHILDFISLVDFGVYADEIDNTEATPFLKKIADAIKQCDYHIEEEILDELHLLASAEDDEDYSNISFFLSLLNL